MASKALPREVAAKQHEMRKATAQQYTELEATHIGHIRAAWFLEASIV